MIWIKVLAPSRREKGPAFELLMRQVLDAVSLSPTRTRLRVTGIGPSLDFRGRQQRDGTPFLGESHALSREVALEELRPFFNRFRRERRKSKKLRGFFLSFTPFSPQALKWYQGLDDNIRESLQLLGPEAIATHLAEDHHLQNFKALEAEVAASSTFPPGPSFLVFLHGNLYWVQTLMVRGRPMTFLILQGRGGPAPTPIAQEIKRLDPTLRDKRLLDLGLRSRILLELLPYEPRTADELAQAVGEPPQNTLSLLQWLEKEEVVTSQRAPGKSRRLDRYRLNRGFPNFLHLARQFLPGADRFRLLASRFASETMTSGLESYLEERFRLKLSAEDTEAVVNLLSISPSALSFALFSAQDYISSDGNTDVQFIPNGEREKLREAARARFITDLSLRATTDSLHGEFSTLLAARDVRAYLAKIQVKASTLQHPLFSLHAQHLHTLPGPKPATDAELSLELGAVMRLIQENNHALQYLDRAIRDLKNPTRLKAAWNIKGLCLFNKRRYQQAIECFNEAIRLDNNLKQAWFNKGICLREVGDTLGALRCVKRALEIDPAYKEAKELLHRFQS